ncbi:sensor domain-containing protein [Actimicrobium antarcticum]|uniref:PAS domain S-box-containing protein/diguanylate cyclase (GGDEF) domain-containing protein n=1 Tax=Actimicrobium antarcticum TaxID=1051899 RepID=A0ABP7U1A1_9BURK
MRLLDNFNLKTRVALTVSLLVALAILLGAAASLNLTRQYLGTLTSEQLSAMAQTILASAVALSLLFGMLVWYTIHRQIAPLQQLRQRIHASNLGCTSNTGNDITDLANAFDLLLKERQHADHRYHASEQRLRLIADNIPALVAYVDADRRVIFANRKYEQDYGVAYDKLTGLPLHELLGPDVYAQSEVFMREVMGGRAINFERLVTHTGAVRWERVSYVPELDADGRVAGFISLAEDITELKRAQHTFAKSEMRLRMITDNMPALIAYIDQEEHYRFCNGHYETILNLAPEKVLGQTVRQVTGEAGYKELALHIKKVLRGERVSFEQQSEKNDKRYFLHDYIPDLDAAGLTIGFYSMVVDITPRKLAELRQQASDHLLRSVTDSLPALVSFIDADERFQFNNQPYEQWFGRPLSRIRGHHVVELMTPDEAARHKIHFEKARQGHIARFEFESRQDDIIHYYQAAYLPQVDQNQQFSGVCSMINDITNLKVVENKLRILARHDTLTGLPNRNQFDEKLAEAMARSRRSGQAMALMFLDIDHFKSINDTLGHHSGDEVLREFSRRLLRSVRSTDTVSRLAGDEFVIILEGLHLPDESAMVAAKIIAAMAADFDILGVARKVSTSIGIAIGDDSESDGDALLRRADEALYDAKAAGRNTFRTSYLLARTA